MQLNQEQENTFFTLIVKEDLEGVLYDSYLIAYQMSDSFALAYEAGTKNLRQFEGTLQRYVLNSGRTFNDIEPFCEEQEIVNDDPDDTGDGTSGPGDGDLGNDSGDPVDGSSDGTSSDSGSTGGTTGGSSLPPIVCSSTQMVKNCGCTGGGCAEGFHSTVTCGSNPENGGVGYGASASFLDSVQCFESEKSMYGGVKASGCGEEDIIIIEEDETEEPCDNFNDLENDQDFKDQMELLQNLAQTDNKETAYKMVADGDGGYNFSAPIEGPENTLALGPVNIPDGEVLEGFIHNHFDMAGSLSVFSPGDLYSIYAMAKAGHLSDSFVMVVTTSDNTMYAITIEDSASFIAFGDVNLEGLQIDDNNSIPSVYEGEEKELFPNGITDTSTNGLNEESFAKLLGFANTGLNLFKSDNNFENWQMLSFNSQNNNVENQNCN